jgi:hypothetical protein
MPFLGLPRVAIRCARTFQGLTFMFYLSKRTIFFPKIFQLVNLRD